MIANPGKFTDGEVLPLVGGPCDGGSCGMVLPWIDDGCSCLLRFGDHVYELDHQRRCWVYAGELPAAGAVE